MNDNIPMQSAVDYSETMNKLGRLLKELNIKSAFYVDDFHAKIELPLASGLLRSFIDKNRNEVQQKLGEIVNLSYPDIELILDDFERKWQGFGEAEKQNIFKDIISIGDNSFKPEDYDRATKLKSIFPPNTIKLISPDEWEEVFKELSQNFNPSEYTLFIFDQDLSKSISDDFRNGTIKGDDLILQVKKSSIRNNAYCTLLTHKIDSVSNELVERKKIIEEKQQDLQEEDFFALTKLRIEDPELFCDGIKKAILNKYFEEIKNVSKDIISDAQNEVIKEIECIDTYDFDQAILISSVEEGVWEVETLLRVAKILYEVKLKTLMRDKHYSASINPSIKKAKKISDIQFNLPNNIHPYNDSYKIRRAELYIDDNILNTLNSPLENGDIFEVYEGDGLGKYILLGQECDLMMRKDGSREAKYGILCKIDEQKIKFVVEGIKSFAIKHGIDNHYLNNKFILEHFGDANDEIGIINFKKPLFINLNILDLVVYNDVGIANTIGLETISIDLLSASWEKRLNKLKKYFTQEKKELNKIFQTIDNIEKPIRDSITKRLLTSAVDKTLGLTKFENNEFSYSIKRIKRLRTPYNKNLLDKYTKYIGRIADVHDFSKKPELT